MKKLIATLAMFLSLGLSVQAQAPAGKPAKQAVRAVAAADTGDVKAYEGAATGVASAADSGFAEASASDGWREDIPAWRAVDGPFTLMAYLTTKNPGGIIVAIFCVILCIVAVASPIVLVCFIFYFLFRRHNDRYRIMEQAVEKGVSLPKDLFRDTFESKERLFRKGVRTASIGLGVIVFSFFVHNHTLCGIGFMIAIYGAGQALIGRTSRRRDESEDKEETIDGGLR